MHVYVWLACVHAWHFFLFESKSNTNLTLLAVLLAVERNEMTKKKKKITCDVKTEDIDDDGNKDCGSLQFTLYSITTIIIIIIIIYYRMGWRVCRCGTQNAFVYLLPECVWRMHIPFYMNQYFGSVRFGIDQIKK